MDTQFHLKTTELNVAEFKRFCEKHKLTQTEGFAKMADALQRREDIQDDAQALRIEIAESADRLMEMVSGLKALYDGGIKDMEYDRALEAKVIAQERKDHESKVASLELNLRETKRSLAQAEEERLEAENELSEASKNVDLLNGALESANKRNSLLESKVASQDVKLSQALAEKTQLEGFKSEVDRLKELLQGERNARLIAEAKLESVTALAEIYKAELERAREREALTSRLPVAQAQGKAME
jgi:chromosome segregation ATPase